MQILRGMEQIRGPSRQYRCDLCVVLFDNKTVRARLDFQNRRVEDRRRPVVRMKYGARRAAGRWLSQNRAKKTERRGLPETEKKISTPEGVRARKVHICQIESSTQSCVTTISYKRTEGENCLRSLGELE